MSVQPNNLNVSYGLSQALLNVFPAPIIALRAPTSSDKAQLGTVWVDKPNNTGYLLTSVVNNLANWEAFSGGGVFDSLTVTGTTTLTGTTSINPTGNANTSIGNLIGTGSTTVVGDIVGIDASTQILIAGLTATVLDIGLGQVTMTVNTLASDFTGPISSADPITINSISSAALSLPSGGITAELDIISANGDIVAQAGNVLAQAINLAGPVQILTGAGVPANGLALNTGDLYINTAAATATTRLYIATGVGAWTFFTANA